MTGTPIATGEMMAIGATTGIPIAIAGMMTTTATATADVIVTVTAIETIPSTSSSSCCVEVRPDLNGAAVNAD